MFKISPIQSEIVKQKCAQECGTHAIDTYFAYQMIDRETDALMGMSQFEINAAEGYIVDLKPAVGYDDFEAMFILGRQTLNFIDTCGAHKCRAAKNAGDKTLLIAIGFKQNEDGEYFCDMSDMFSGHCSGETVKLPK